MHYTDPNYANPQYPDLGVKIAKLRHGADRKAHGLAVLEAFRAMQRNALKRAAPPAKMPTCASGTFNQTGEQILQAVREQNRARSTRIAIWYDERKQRELYAALMAAKNGRQST